MSLKVLLLSLVCLLSTEYTVASDLRSRDYWHDCFDIVIELKDYIQENCQGSQEYSLRCQANIKRMGKRAMEQLQHGTSCGIYQSTMTAFESKCSRGVVESYDLYNGSEIEKLIKLGLASEDVYSQCLN